MTDRQLKNHIERLDAIAEQQKALEAQAEAIRNEIKADMEERGADKVSVFGRIVRWKEIVSNRLDGKALKAALQRFITSTASLQAARDLQLHKEKIPLPERQLW